VRRRGDTEFAGQIDFRPMDSFPQKIIIPENNHSSIHHTSSAVHRILNGSTRNK
jgi:hypothetical protein